MVVPTREARYAKRRYFAVQENDMKRNKDFRQCLALLRAKHSNSNLKPEQKDQIGIVIDRVKELGRKKNPSHAEVFACVKELSERFLRVILRND